MTRMHVVFVSALAGGLLALPACGKKTEPAAGGGDPAAHTGSKAGPPGGFPPPVPGGKVTTGWPDDLLDQARKQTEANLKKIGLGMLQHCDEWSKFPVGYFDKSGKTVGLSWRVAILPYIEQDALYKQFKLDEPWDSPANKPLVAQMPKVFAPPGNSTPVGHTFYCGFTGHGMLLDPPYTPGQPGRPAGNKGFLQIADGLANTAMVVEAAEAVPWTKPDTLDIDPKNHLSTVGGVFEGGFWALRCDGSSSFVKNTIDAKTLRNFALTADGNPITIP